jgi:hypothetical protein
MLGKYLLARPSSYRIPGVGIGAERTRTPVLVCISMPGLIPRVLVIFGFGSWSLSAVTQPLTAANTAASNTVVMIFRMPVLRRRPPCRAHPS